MYLRIDPSSPTPLRAQVIEQIKKLIDRGTLEQGLRLPATRKLAERLGVSRSTVYEAYGELQAMGYLRSRPGSYNIVQKRERAVEYDPGRKSHVSWQELSAPAADIVFETYKHFGAGTTPVPRASDKLLNLAGLDPDARLFPLRDFKRSMNSVLSTLGADTLGYGTHKGYPPLREYIAHRLRLHGIRVAADEILVTNGAQQAIDLVLRLLVNQHRAVIIEAPSYGIILPLLKLHSVNVISVPMIPDGMDLVALEQILERHRVSFIYTMPNFQNPTGITTSHDHRERLLNLCTRYRTPLLEDGFEEDLKYFGKVDLPIKSIDKANVVLYIGTFSKALFPGLRLGWITGHRECIDRLTAIKRYADLSTANLTQAVMHHFCEQGYYDLHLKRLHRIYRRRMDVALKAMARVFPKGIEWTKPAGGYTLWVRMPRKLNLSGFQRAFHPHGVLVAPGMLFFPDARTSEYFRISIATLNEVEITEAVQRLGRALREIT